MIIIEQIKGLTAKPNAPEFKPSSEQPIAHIPNYISLMNPDFVEGTTALNQVDGTMLENKSNATSDRFIEIDGRKFFNTPLANPLYFRFDPNQDLNGREFTCVFVCKPDAATLGGLLGCLVVGNDAIGDTSIKVAFSASRGSLSFFGNGGTSNAVDPKVQYILTPEDRANLRLYVVSFSTEKGYEIRVNGKKVVENTNDKTERTTQLKAGEWSVQRGFTGLLGINVVLGIDLTLPRNSIFLTEIESHFMSKYNIAP